MTELFDFDVWGVVGVLFVAVYGVLQWLNMSRDEQRKFVDDLVRRSQQVMTDENGAAKMDFVLNETKKRFPWLPVDFIRILAESAVQRMKSEEVTVTELQPFDFSPPEFELTGDTEHKKALH